MRTQRGFSLIELMVVVAVIAMITAIATPQLLGARSKSLEARVEEDLRTLAKAAQALYDDTGVWPGGLGDQPCAAGPETVVTSCVLGLYCTNGSYDAWNGPYIQSGPDALHEGRDPWGNPYIYDTDYYDGTRVGRVFHSGGPNESAINVYDDDNIVLYMCAQLGSP